MPSHVTSMPDHRARCARRTGGARCGGRARCARRADGRRLSPGRAAVAVVVALSLLGGVFAPAATARVGAVASPAAQSPAAPAPGGGDSLEAAASRAGDTGRKIAMSLIGLGFAVAAIVLSFRRDFKEAAGVFAVGIVAVLLATPAGLRLLRDTVASLFGAQ